MLKKLSLVLGAGYLQKAVQVFCGLITIPILVSDNGLGLSGYGRLAVLLSISALLSMALDGFRLMASRDIGAGFDRLYQATIAHLVYSSVLALCLSLITVSLADPLLKLIGLEGLSRYLLYWACLFFTLEQLLYVLEQTYHAQLKTYYVNGINSIESIVRLAAIFLLFQLGSGDIATYFKIFTGTYALKVLLHLATLGFQCGQKEDFAPLQNVSTTDFRRVLVSAYPLSLQAGAQFFVYRLSVIIANREFSAESAGLFSIVFITLRGYMTQLFVNVLRPLIVPNFSKIVLSRSSLPANLRHIDAVACYEAFVIVCILIIVATTSAWLPMWLGTTFHEFVPLFCAGVAFLGLESVTALRCLVLISQNHGTILSKTGISLSGMFVGGVYLFYSFGQLTLQVLVIAIFTYIVAYNVLAASFLYSRYIATVNRTIAPFGIISLLGIYYIYSFVSASYSAVVSSLLLFAVIGATAFAYNKSVARLYRSLKG